MLNHFYKSVIPSVCGYNSGKSRWKRGKTCGCATTTCPHNPSGAGCEGTVSISGAPQLEAHHLLVSTLAAILELSLPAVH